MAKQEYKIGDFRKAVGSIRWKHDDFSGHVEFERLRCDLRTAYAERIAKVESMLPTLQKRYADDRSHALDYIRYANEQIEWNEANQIEAFAAGQRHGIFFPITQERFE